MELEWSNSGKKQHLPFDEKHWQKHNNSPI
jgi:hypothetical protein